jgi:hypothetical protein
MIRLHPTQTSQVHVSDGLREIDGVYKQHGVNLVLRKLALLAHFVYYRFWETGQKYRQGGFGALTAYIGKFLTKVTHG